MHQYKKLKGNEASNHKSSYKIVICQADIDVLSFSLNQFDKKKKKKKSSPTHCVIILIIIYVYTHYLSN